MLPLPHALESLLSILVAVQQDNASDGSSLSLSLRQSYATALIRLVNGLVDPLQSGTYARSILSIAAQIGLPAWLVELRHAATHEDLPSLELLRDGAKEVSLLSLLSHLTINELVTHSRVHPSPGSHLAIAQLFSPHSEPSTIFGASATALGPPCGTAAATVQERAEDGRTRRVSTCAPGARYRGRAARDRALVGRGARCGHADACGRVCVWAVVLSWTAAGGGRRCCGEQW